MTNIVIDPQTAATIQALPPNWQHYAIAGVMIAMVAGRLLTALQANAGIWTAIKSVFGGSVHTAAPTQTNAVPKTP